MAAVLGLIGLGSIGLGSIGLGFIGPGVASAAITNTSFDSQGVPDSATSAAAVAEPAGHKRVTFGVRSDDPDFGVAAIEEVLGSSVADAEFELDVVVLPQGGLLEHLDWATTQARREDNQAVIWLEAADDDRLQLYLMQPGSERVWVREVPMASDPQVRLESLGVLVNSLAQGLDRGEPAGMQELPRQDPSTSPPDAPPDPEPAPRPVQVMIYGGYRGASLAADAPWQSGASGRLAFYIATHGFVGIGAGWMGAPSINNAQVDFRLHRIPVDLRGGYRFTPLPWLMPEVDLTVAVELMRWRSVQGNGVAEQPGPAIRIAMAPGGGLSFRVWKGLGLQVHGQLGIWVVNANLVVDIDNTRTSVLRPPLIDGQLDVGVYWTF